MADRYQSRPYPTDDDYHRGNEPYSPSVESDPLAELARLIGQTDPFAGAGTSRANAQPQPMAGQQYQPPQYQPPLEEFEEEQSPAGPPSWMQRANRREVPQPNYPSQGQPDQDYRDRHTYPEQNYPEQNYQADPGYGGTGQSHSSYAYPDQDHPGAEYPLRRYPGHPDPVQERHLHEPSFESAAFESAEQPLDPSRYDEALFGPLDTDRQDNEYGQAYSDDPYAYQGYGDEAEEEAPKRRGGLTTVVAVLALAVIGTGGAFAYRSYIGSPRTGTPPIIRADTSPTKIIPAAATDGNKAPDRYASADGTEKIVPREETPVDVNANVSSTPRVIFPPPNVSQNQSQPPVASVTPTTPPDLGSGLMPNSQPRKIKTLTVSNDDAGAAAAAAAPVAQPSATKPAPAVRNVRTAPASTADAYANTNAPMSIAPQAIQNGPAPRQQVATNAPEPITPSTTATGYMVQVSSQRNEVDAQSSYRVLQGKFPSVLGSRSPTIKRADLGEKGVYYRAMVGPFGSAEEASQFCGSLKSAGGQCVVQRN